MADNNSSIHNDTQVNLGCKCYQQVLVYTLAGQNSKSRPLKSHRLGALTRLAEKKEMELGLAYVETKLRLYCETSITIDITGLQRWRETKQRP